MKKLLSLKPITKIIFTSLILMSSFYSNAGRECETTFQCSGGELCIPVTICIDFPG
jgi:hypothetical protein